MVNGYVLLEGVMTYYQIIYLSGTRSTMLIATIVSSSSWLLIDYTYFGKEIYCFKEFIDSNNR